MTDAVTQKASQQPRSMDSRRRRLIKGIAAAAGAGMASAYLPSSSAADGSNTADDFDDIQHIVVVMMENRSFDHMMSWVPGAEVPDGIRLFPTEAGELIQSYPLLDTQNFEVGDPPHGYWSGRVCTNDGAMDGFIRSWDQYVDQDGEGEPGNTLPVGYFRREQVPFYSACADYFTIGDHYFTGILSSTWPNRIYMHAGQTDRLYNNQGIGGVFSQLDTIWDIARQTGVSHRYYYSDAPYTAIWGARHLSISKPFLQFLWDARNGQLPSFCFVDPAFIGESLGLSNDDHPMADIRNGQAFLNSVYEALRTSPLWPNTLLVINYDEWGGFADHVLPPMAPVCDRERTISEEGNDGQLGIRVPLVLIGPRARRNALANNGSSVVSDQYDPNAILNFICDRFGMPRLDVVRSATSGSLATALLPREQADYSVPPAFDVNGYQSIILRQERVGGTATNSGISLQQAFARGMGGHIDALRQLQAMALDSGFELSGIRL